MALKVVGQRDQGSVNELTIQTSDGRTIELVEIPGDRSFLLRTTGDSYLILQPINDKQVNIRLRWPGHD